MNKSLVLLASFAGLVACFGEKSKSEEATDGQTTTETCPADAATAAPAVEEKKPEAAPAATETPAATTEPTTAQ